MTKVWLLYDNPFNEGDNIYGVFSTEEKVNYAHGLLSKFSKDDLYILDYDVDELEKKYERLLSGRRLYIGRRKRYQWSSPISYGEWEEFYQSGLDSLLEEEKPDYVFETRHDVSANIRAISSDEAKEKAEKIFQEKSDGYNVWLGSEK